MIKDYELAYKVLGITVGERIAAEQRCRDLEKRCDKLQRELDKRDDDADVRRQGNTNIADIIGKEAVEMLLAAGARGEIIHTMEGRKFQDAVKDHVGKKHIR